MRAKLQTQAKHWTPIKDLITDPDPRNHILPIYNKKKIV